MKRVLSNGLMIAGILTVPASVTHTEIPETPAEYESLTKTEIPAAKAEYQNDPRLDILKRFFRASDCPAQHFSVEFLKAADKHKLDWRLLPSISLVESGGGRDAPNNNLFGWDGGRAIFTSMQAGIHNVADRLHNSKLYRHKGLDEILRLYNPNENYPQVVKSVMRRISPDEKL